MSCRHAKLSPEFDDLDIGIALYDPETGAVLDVNERVESLYGYSAGEIRTMDLEEYTAPSTNYTPADALEHIRAAADGDPQVFEWRIERATGELRWVRIHLNRTTIAEAECVIAEIYDISEYKVRERRLRLLSRIIRHNLRNDMTVLMGYAERLQAGVESDSLNDAAQSIIEIAQDVGTLSDSVTQLEEIAEPDVAQRTPTDLRTVVRALVEDTRAAYPDVELMLDAPTTVSVIADRGINYALTHAIENAIEHNDCDTPVVTISVADDPANGRGVIRVADNGPSIPEIEIDVLDAETETSSTYHGSGVGLWVMKWCVDSLGGELTFEENTPRGNIVSLALPRAAQSA